MGNGNRSPVNSVSGIGLYECAASEAYIASLAESQTVTLNSAFIQSSSAASGVFTCVTRYTSVTAVSCCSSKPHSQAPKNPPPPAAVIHTYPLSPLTSQPARQTDRQTDSGGGGISSRKVPSYERACRAVCRALRGGRMGRDGQLYNSSEAQLGRREALTSHN